jgi:hypothetical protein
MNEQKKPLSTEQIAGGRGDHATRDRDRVETSDRGLNDAAMSETNGGGSTAGTATQARGDSAGAQTDGRQTRELAYSESSMSGRDTNPALMPAETLEQHREHWTEIQTRFVDDPRDAVSQADELVAEVMQTVATRFAGQRKNLEGKWQGGGQASSEDLRQALLQYRSFFERLLAA